MRTIGEELERHHGYGPGFDVLRLGFATLVLYIHTSILAPGVVGVTSEPLFTGAPIDRWSINYAALPMFFALSGFLVAASADRLTLGRFFTNRAFRIIPGLSVEIVLSALVLGPLLTTIPLRDYFLDPRFARYFLNLFGLIQYQLPGVFAANPMPNIINGSLWTVPHEFSCYVLLILFKFTGLYRSRLFLLLATIGLFAMGVLVPYVLAIYPELPFGSQLNYIFVTRGAAKLVPAFLTGMVIYRYRDVLPYRRAYGLLALAVFIGLCMLGEADWENSPAFNAIAAPLLAYAVVIAGLSPNLRIKWANADYSYGICLYGYPLQQTILAIYPEMTSVTLFFILALVATVAMAMMSRHFVELPVKRLIRSAPRPTPAPSVKVEDPSQAQPGAAVGPRANAAFA